MANNLNSVPGKLKAVIKFGFDEGFKNRVSQLGETFDDWIDAVFVHTQAHFRHTSLGTEIHFEVGFVYLHGQLCAFIPRINSHNYNNSKNIISILQPYKLNF